MSNIWLIVYINYEVSLENDMWIPNSLRMHIDGLMQDCSNAIANALDLL